MKVSILEDSKHDFVRSKTGQKILGIGSRFLTLPTQVIEMNDAALELVMGEPGEGEVQLTAQLLFVDAESGGASEALALPPEAECEGLVLVIVATGGEGVAVTNDADGAILTVATGDMGIFVCDGTSWYGLADNS